MTTEKIELTELVLRNNKLYEPKGSELIPIQLEVVGKPVLVHALLYPNPVSELVKKMQIPEGANAYYPYYGGTFEYAFSAKIQFYKI